MNKFFSQLKKEAQAIRLSTREREVMLLALEKVMRPHAPLKSSIRIFPSPYIFFAPRLISSLAFVLILAVVGGSTAYAAEGAVPGDLLYPIKLNVNETVASAFAVSPEAKATVHARLAERRMQEAESLAARGTLTAEIKEELEANLEGHAQIIQDSVALVEEGDPVVAADISTRFESALSAHSAVIARLGGHAESRVSRYESENFARSLKERGERLARADGGISMKAERNASGDIALSTFARGSESGVTAAVVVRDSDAAFITRLENNASTTLDEAETGFAALKWSLDATTSARVQAQINKIRGLIETFRKQKANMSSEKDQIERAFKDAVTVKAFIEAQQKFQGHVLFPEVGIGENGEDDFSGNDTENEDNDPEGQNVISLPARDSGLSL